MTRLALAVEHVVVPEPAPTLRPLHVDGGGEVVVGDLLARPDGLGHGARDGGARVVLGDVLVTAGVQ